MANDFIFEKNWKYPFGFCVAHFKRTLVYGVKAWGLSIDLFHETAVLPWLFFLGLRAHLAFPMYILFGEQ